MFGRTLARLSAFLVLLWPAVVALKSPPVEVSLRTSWPAPPLLLEIIETAAQTNPDRFFEIAALLSELGPLDHTPAQKYTAALNILQLNKMLSSDFETKVFELEMAAHKMNPLVVAHFQADASVKRVPGCESWVEWGDERICDMERLKELVRAQEWPAPPQIFPFDHIHENEEIVPHATLLHHGNPSTKFFASAHMYLTAIPHIRYVLRWTPPYEDPEEPAYLSGWGVTLDLKKTEYSALDDRLGTKTGSDASDGNKETEGTDDILDLIRAFKGNATEDDQPELKGEETEDEDTEETASKDPNVPLTEEEQLALPLQITQLILSAEDPLAALSGIARSFPSYAPIIARSMPAPDPLSYEPQLTPGFSAVWLNGGSLSANDFSALSLPRILRTETNIVKSIARLGLTEVQAAVLLSNASVPGSAGEDSVTEGRIDAREAEDEQGAILWWNNVAKDKRYQRYVSSLTGILRPTYPGSFHPVARNIYNVVLYLDYANGEAIQLIAGYINTLIQRNVPIRFATVGAGEGDSKRVARVISYVVRTYGRSTAMKLFTALGTDASTALDGPIPLSSIKKVYTSWLSTVDLPTLEGKETKIWDEIIDVPEEATDGGERWARRLGVFGEPGGFVNGKWIPYDDTFMMKMQSELSRCLQHVQEQLYYGRIDDLEDIDTYFYRLPGTTKRLSRYVQPTTDRPLRIMDLSQVFPKSGWNSRWIWPSGNDDVPVSVWVVADFSTPAGADLAREAIIALETDSRFRLSFVPSTNEHQLSDSPSIISLTELLYRLTLTNRLSTVTAEELLNLITHGSHPELHEMMDESERLLLQQATNNANDFSEWLRKGAETTSLLGLGEGRNGVVLNGRVIPIDSPDFNADDIQAVVSFELRKRVQPVVTGLEQLYTAAESPFDRRSYADLVAYASSITAKVQAADPSAGLLQTAVPQRTVLYKDVTKGYSYFTIGDETHAIHRFGVVLDPISEVAQRWPTVLQWLSTLDSVYIEVILNPRADGSTALLKSYYKSILPFQLTFGEDGRETRPALGFYNLPESSIYTLAMDTPPAWLVRPRESPYDLDNIFLATLPPSARAEGVKAIFELQYLVVEGHAREALSKFENPPRGAQVQIAPINSSVALDDTMIMANLGYLQLKARPGVFEFDLRAGRTSEVFELQAVGNDGWSSKPANETGPYLTVTSFEGMTIYPRLKRRLGMEKAEVLQESVPSGLGFDLGGLLDPLYDFASKLGFSNLKPEPKAVATTKPQADINIFTVASGLLYERFALIMTLSVMRHTNHTVKFWFIENFLSPSFLEIIPYVAQEFGFDYELVTYKWPSWLRAQKEKQRVIWAYKILFLDVLFPLDLKKVIFVDADQIVRTDLKELVDLDLHSAPYGYTPMGNDREDMEGFRFWKTGYWKEQLRGKPYHISALYVIDLVRFRQLAAGDRLRGQYQGLSADPNSLANLDQDLPNNMQHEIPIYSLDKDWLWCETWCSGDRLARAKTIDLCQNPLTKEPKLARARAIPEWEVYDSEIATLTRRLAKEGKIHWSAAMADSDALANVGKASAAAVAVDEATGTQEGTRVEEAEPESTRESVILGVDQDILDAIAATQPHRPREEL
ncbi:glycosyltransferase family 24 protein [Calocera viscosa TUFC12733]|uniref:Glycosyltransferase family 24 protein n=1 Tax=Calocera viscosa (strain TUFC12733) TaxID=1330018 RepID=A0A167L733_CALVF|nr:glycosyltransferase family 24 protein [Calocera viscosa TUFC12733]